MSKARGPWVLRALVTALAGAALWPPVESFAIDLKGLLRSAKKAAGQEVTETKGQATESPGAPAVQAVGDTLRVEAGLLDEILLTPDPYYYESLGRRDPFQSLISDAYREDAAEEDRATGDDLIVVGVLWSDTDRYALVETTEGKSLILHEGDRYGPAEVTRVNPDGIVLYVNEYGVGKTVKVQVYDPKMKRVNHESRER